MASWWQTSRWPGAPTGRRRSCRTAPVRRTARPPAPGWRQRGSSQAAPPCRAVRARGYRGGAWTSGGNSRAENRVPILSRDREGRLPNLRRSIDQAAVERRQKTVVEGIRNGWPLAELEILGELLDRLLEPRGVDATE